MGSDCKSAAILLRRFESFPIQYKPVVLKQPVFLFTRGCLIMENGFIILEMTTNNFYSILGAAISAIILLCLGAFFKLPMEYKNLRGRTIYNLKYAERFYKSPEFVNPNYGEASEEYKETKSVLMENASKIKRFTYGLYRPKFLKRGVPDGEMLISVAEAIESIANGLAAGDRDKIESIAKKNIETAENIKKLLNYTDDSSAEK